MRYRTNDDYARETAYARLRTGVLEAHLKRLIVILYRKDLTDAERKTLELAMEPVWMTSTEVTDIQNGDKEWPKVPKS
jgi:hypothetical protein